MSDLAIPSLAFVDALQHNHPLLFAACVVGAMLLEGVVLALLFDLVVKVLIRVRGGDRRAH